MEFSEKLQQLRKQKGLTQEELAKNLYVSRTAVSKWESGRGYPNLDSLKDISDFFLVTVDELLSGDELLSVAKKDNEEKQNRLKDTLFALLDISIIMLFFLPFFAQKIDDVIFEVGLLELTEISLYLKIVYFISVLLCVVVGVLILAFRRVRCKFWEKHKRRLSILLNIIAVCLFIASLQPYASVLLFVYLIIKVTTLVKW